MIAKNQILLKNYFLDLLYSMLLFKIEGNLGLSDGILPMNLLMKI